MKKNLFYIPILLVILIIIFWLLSSYNKSVAKTTSKTEIWLDTPCTITIYDKETSNVLDQCFNELERIQNLMNVSDTKSEVSKINSSAGIKPVTVSDETYNVIKESIKYSEKTSGEFDISVGPLVVLWGINTVHAAVPSKTSIDSLLPLVNYKNIVLDDTEKSVFLKVKGMSIDLGGIAKGYAGDKVSEVLNKNGVRHAIIDLGGNIVAVGSKADGSNWNIGIRNPEIDGDGNAIGIVKVANSAIVTSGIYERYFKENNKIYHHILDPKTGYPVDNNLLCVTIISDSSLEADANAKAFCLGLTAGLKYIEEQSGLEAVFITKEKKVYVTDGLKDKITITNNNFKLMQ